MQPAKETNRDTACGLSRRLYLQSRRLYLQLTGAAVPSVRMLVTAASFQLQRIGAGRIHPKHTKNICKIAEKQSLMRAM